MKKYFKKSIKTLFVILFIAPFLVGAATYNLLEPLPGYSSGAVSADNAGIQKYIQNGYNYALGLAIALSVLMMVIGGVEYTMTFASESKKGEAKARIDNAVTGLLIALLSYVVLYTINPNLTTLSLPEATESCDAAQKSGIQAEAIPQNTKVTGSAAGSGSNNNYQLQLKGDQTNTQKSDNSNYQLQLRNF